ncbi:MAG: copper homeostasis protein CutC [Bacteroidota bacterium]
MSHISPNRRRPLFEVCLQSVAGAIAAQAGGADRIELCAALTVGGITPSYGTIQACVKAVDLPIMVMIRPRGGDFYYDHYEFASMQDDIAICKELGVTGVVFGMLNTNGTIDEARTRKLVELAKPLQITFHRAFDVCADPHRALDQLIEIGVDRVLTSGQVETAPQGKDLIKQLIERSKDSITILPGCGLTPDNLTDFLSSTQPNEYHATAFSRHLSPMQHKNEQVYMGLPGLPEYERQITSQDLVEEFVKAAKKFNNPLKYF